MVQKNKKGWVLEMSRYIGAYFASKQFAVMSEVTVNLPCRTDRLKHYRPGQYRLDIVGINRKLDIVIVETKSCKSDFNSDEKWKVYLPICNRFYFATDEDTAGFIAETVKRMRLPQVGVMAVSNRKTGIILDNVRIIRPSRIKVHCMDERELLWRMAARGSGFDFRGRFFTGNSFETRADFWPLCLINKNDPVE